MKTRVISAIVGLTLVAIIMFFARQLLPAAVFILSLIGIYEFYNAVSRAGYKPVKIIGYVSCLSLLIIGYEKMLAGSEGLVSFLCSGKFLSFVVYVILAVLMSLIVFEHKKYNVSDIAITVFGIVYVVFLFSFIITTRNMENGAYYIWLIFISAWATDTFAFFTGITIGKRKLIPAVSPKKTKEGSVGGIIGCVIAVSLYGIYLRSVLPEVPFYHFIVIGLLCGVISQIGDLAASAVKRFVNIKDYGNIMPGHGGVLDRVDSILFVAPVIYYYISFIL